MSVLGLAAANWRADPRTSARTEVVRVRLPQSRPALPFGQPCSTQAAFHGFPGMCGSLSNQQEDACATTEHVQDFSLRDCTGRAFVLALVRITLRRRMAFSI